VTTTLYEQLLERSHVEDIPYASGFLVCGLMARTKDDAAQLRARHAEMHAQNEARRAAARRPEIGREVPEGTVWHVDVEDGEMTYRTLRIEWNEKGDRPIAVIDRSEATELARPRDNHRNIRLAARWIAERRTAIVDSTERDVHGAIRSLAHAILRGSPIPPAPPTLLAGAETPVGAITLRSLIDVGQVVWTEWDAQRAAEMSGDERREGGHVIAVSQHDTGRIFTVLREGVRPEHGGLVGLQVGHVHERAVHLCDVDGCLSCPRVSRDARRLFRRCHLACAVGPGRKGQLRPAEAVLLNVATTLLRAL
jgi:hypothetical protein